MNFNDYLDEALKVKYVVRDRKKVKKYKTTRPGKYKVQYDANGKPREVRLTTKEKRNRHIGHIKGKIKLQSKMQLAKKRQKMSMVARQNMGIKYNKKLPDINLHRTPYVPVKKQMDKEKDKLLSPKFKNFHESFQDYLDEQLLLEWPQGIIWSDETKGIEIGWDFCQEASEDGEWLRQLVDLYKYGFMKTLRDDRNQPANEDGFISNPYIEFSAAQIEDITDTLCYDWGFLTAVRVDFKDIKDEQLLADLEKYLPKRLWDKIIGEQQK